MTKELYEPHNEDVRKNSELTIKLKAAETEIGSLKSANERLANGLLTLCEKLQDATNEVGRLNMVLKNRAKAFEYTKRPGKRI